MAAGGQSCLGNACFWKRGAGEEAEIATVTSGSEHQSRAGCPPPLRLLSLRETGGGRREEGGGGDGPG